MSKILKKCDALIERRELVSEAQIKRLLERLHKLRDKPTNNRIESSAVLFKSLAVALTLSSWGTGSPMSKRRLNKLLDKLLAKEIRPSTRESLTIVKLCAPNKHRRDYTRYADAVMIAVERSLSATEFFQELKEGDGGMSGFIERGSGS